ncbi:transporter substrate-binding domain-containing protein [Corynebacterium sp.]|uniref:transporter substrate-binding domain-containing protein n=1 Tax=Corynebacterium sp. TaxID=1720 RepID=UPI0026E06264|nr:transporter substrate-binding domain-containing protein [Corynebacterium sp.]MDO5513358.1 transporter substrate-binding domain-containing protein [Corynebacterium sp.]
MRHRSLTALIAAGLPLAACGAIPADSEGTLDRARGGTLVVGVSEHRPWTTIEESGAVTGTEVDLITAFADSIDADIEWHTGPESVLADLTEDGELDVVIGGLTSESPWADKMALTRPYSGDQVMGLRMGENELLMTLERHLAREHGEI